MKTKDLTKCYLTILLEGRWSFSNSYVLCFQWFTALFTVVVIHKKEGQHDLAARPSF